MGNNLAEGINQNFVDGSLFIGSKFENISFVDIVVLSVVIFVMRGMSS